jgi:hypothetical protein
VVNHPPTVSIFTPTNGASFMTPAAFTVAADALDTDGYVTNVEFFSSITNKLAETTNTAPAVIPVTNLSVGTYTFTAVATDNLGLRGTSAPVTISVILQLPITVVSAIHLNPQTGLYEETVRVTNPTGSILNAVRVYVRNLSSGARVYNASGTNGAPYVESHNQVAPGSSVDFVIEYYVPSRVTPTRTLDAQLVPVNEGGGVTAVGTLTHVDRLLKLSDGSMLVEFLSISNRIYYMEYSSDLKSSWQTVQPALTGNGTRIQWIDNGQPKTESFPSTVPVRFYRIVLLP